MPPADQRVLPSFASYAVASLAHTGRYADIMPTLQDAVKRGYVCCDACCVTFEWLTVLRGSWSFRMDQLTDTMLALNKARQHELVAQLFAQLQPWGHRPSAPAWLSAISALLQAGRVAQALEYEKSMRLLGIQLPPPIESLLLQLKNSSAAVPKPAAPSSPLPSPSPTSQQ